MFWSFRRICTYLEQDRAQVPPNVLMEITGDKRDKNRWVFRGMIMSFRGITTDIRGDTKDKRDIGVLWSMLNSYIKGTCGFTGFFTGTSSFMGFTFKFCCY